MKPIYIISLILIFLSYNPSYSQQSRSSKRQTPKNGPILPAAYTPGDYIPLLEGRKTGIVANHTSLIYKTHLVDSLIALGINVVKIFGPEHGFRGDQPDGKEISNTRDPKSGVEVISLYGAHRRPTAADMEGLEIMLFDIQDVGTRFYTYISTLTYVMEACAENGIPLILTDRPNPNGFYVDGPVLDTTFSSFIGLHPVPVVYGMTIGEYAAMVNGEIWLKGGKPCEITIIKCKNYTHNSQYQLPVNPSPNLQDMKAIYLYPSLCFFEGTIISVGRGTPFPFKVFGHPEYMAGSFTFTPEPIRGVCEDPPLKGQLCHGQNLSEAAEILKKNGKLELFWLIETYKSMGSRNDFFNGYFDKLAGGTTLKEQIISGMSLTDIRNSWQQDLTEFKKIRKKYLLYPDFK